MINVRHTQKKMLIETNLGRAISPLDIESDPPATTTSACPCSINRMPCKMASKPDKQALLTVTPVIFFGKFKSMTISRATLGALVLRTTFPQMISSIRFGSNLDFFNRPSTAETPNPIESTFSNSDCDSPRFV